MTTTAGETGGPPRPSISLAAWTTVTVGGAGCTASSAAANAVKIFMGLL
jgi:hypothetical protein